MPRSELVVAPPVPRTARSRAATRELWLDRLARFPASGLTVAQFCAIEAVAVPTFYFWKRRLAAQATTAATAHRVKKGAKKDARNLFNSHLASIMMGLHQELLS